MVKTETNKREELFKAILALDNADETRRFFRDLLTEKEIIEFANRWQAAQLLDQRVSYVKIQKETGLSSATIARIAKWLTQGMGGYRLIINRLNAHHSSNSRDTRSTEA